MTIQELLQRETDLQSLLYDVRQDIYSYDDGCIYKVRIQQYGNTTLQQYTNIHAAYRCASKYTGDNGFADIYTNNENACLKDKQLYGGSLYYLYDIESFDRHTRLTEGEAKRLR